MRLLGKMDGPFRAANEHDIEHGPNRNSAPAPEDGGAPPLLARRQPTTTAGGLWRSSPEHQPSEYASDSTSSWCSDTARPSGSGPDLASGTPTEE